MYDFPTPFGGIKLVYNFADRDELLHALTYMASGCEHNHDHNIAVEFDGNRIWTTQLGVDCIVRALEDAHV